MRVGSWLGACVALVAGCDEVPDIDVPHELPAFYDSCGGMAGGGCDRGLVCADTPGDGCAEGSGGRDCSGICVACDDDRVARTVVSADPDECAAIDVECHDGRVAWFDDCGCGCQDP